MNVAYAAVFGGDDELRDLPSVDTEDVLHLSGENVPHDDGEVHPSRHQRALVVARRDLVRVEDAGHLVPMTSQRAVGGPTCRTEEDRRMMMMMKMCARILHESSSF